MPRCKKCGSYTKYHNGYCKRCYHEKKFVEHGGSRVSSPGFFGSVLEGETGRAIERTPIAIIAITLLFIIGFWFLLNPDGNKFTGILLMVLGVFWIYQRNKKTIINEQPPTQPQLH